MSTTPFFCEMPSEASVEFIEIDLLLFGSVASCVSPLDACRYNAADAPYADATTIPAATNTALNEAFISAPFEIGLPGTSSIRLSASPESGMLHVRHVRTLRYLTDFSWNGL